MKKVRFIINNHSDRMNLIKVLKDNGYNAKVVSATEYMPTKMVIEVEVKDYEVKE